MTTDKPGDDLEREGDKPGSGEAGCQKGEAGASSDGKPHGKAASVEFAMDDSHRDEANVIEVGPPSLESKVQTFVESVLREHQRAGQEERSDAEAASNVSLGLDDVVEITDFRPSVKVKRVRKTGESSTVTALVKKGLENSNLIELIENEVLAIIDSHSVLGDYEVVFLYDHTLINRTHASAIYQRLLNCDSAKNVLLVLKSPGGQVEPAYLISKLCRRKSKNNFLVCVPGEAKSAATLLSLGADEIHMGAMSELGPIDPQINEYPALAFSSALDKIAQLAEKYPGASEMLAKYLIGSGMDVQALGHYDRIAESYSQYAINLLDSKVTDTSASPISGRKSSAELASYFTNYYKDHNFVIDVDEAIKQLGPEVVILESDIYQACHEIHKFLESCEIAMTLQKKSHRVSVLGNKFILRKP
ncbi:TPA: ATP-dependent Clp protease proteolytic subunit [Pseudomonas aeruginosa]|nr:ATP-dependent Clp protease proteolytic subunit [Pseudomonas aeruginosa]